MKKRKQEIDWPEHPTIHAREVGKCIMKEYELKHIVIPPRTSRKRNCIYCESDEDDDDADQDSE